jgi:plastocyanin
MMVIGETNTMKKLIAVLVTLSVVIVLTAASCGGSSASGNGNGNDVHMGNTTFTQPSITISKGGNVNLIDDVAVLHIISNGSWVNGVATPTTESGAPTINNLQFTTSGQNMNVGPFNTAGTYHIYCSVHPNMNLTVIEQ